MELTQTYAKRPPPKSQLKMETITFEKYEGDQITDEMLKASAQFFSKNYGKWGKEATNAVNPFRREYGQLEGITSRPSTNWA